MHTVLSDACNANVIHVLDHPMLISITTFTLHLAGTVWVCVKRRLLGNLFRAKRYNIIKEE